MKRPLEVCRLGDALGEAGALLSPSLSASGLSQILTAGHASSQKERNHKLLARARQLPASLCTQARAPDLHNSADHVHMHPAAHSVGGWRALGTPRCRPALPWSGPGTGPQPRAMPHCIAQRDALTSAAAVQGWAPAAQSHVRHCVPPCPCGGQRCCHIVLAHWAGFCSSDTAARGCNS